MGARQITVELVYCAHHQQFLKKLTVAAGSSILEIIRLSEIHKSFMEVDFTSSNLQVGVFSKIKSLEYVPKDCERIEIYRQLYQTPMEARRARARRKK